MLAETILSCDPPLGRSWTRHASSKQSEAHQPGPVSRAARPVCWAKHPNSWWGSMSTSPLLSVCLTPRFDLMCLSKPT